MVYHNDQDVSTEWMRVETKLLQVLSQMYSRWGTALQAAHSCQRIRMKEPQECIIRLDTALKEAQELKEILDKYITILEEMKTLVPSTLTK